MSWNVFLVLNNTQFAAVLCCLEKNCKCLHLLTSFFSFFFCSHLSTDIVCSQIVLPLRIYQIPTVTSARWQVNEYRREESVTYCLCCDHVIVLLFLLGQGDTVRWFKVLTQIKRLWMRVVNSTVHLTISNKMLETPGQSEDKCLSMTTGTDTE